MGGASKACLSRLQKEYQRLGKEPVPNVVAEPKCEPKCTVVAPHGGNTDPRHSPNPQAEQHPRVAFCDFGS